MQRPRRTWGEKLIRQNSFVGRSDEQRRFMENLVAEDPSCLLFFVVGEGGVGKSTLLKRFAEIGAKPDINAIVIACDESQMSPAAAMGHIAAQLVRYNIKSKDFDERYKAYRARREEIESDPKAPRGLLDLVGKGMTYAAIEGARLVPGVGVFAGYLDKEAAAEALNQGLNYVADKAFNKDEVALLRAPEPQLTPLLIEALNRACGERRVVLMFDVFERTRDTLELWLLKWLTGEYGDFDLNLSFVVSGREPPDQRWTAIAGHTCRIALEPFTSEETRLYLQQRSITDDALVAQIQEDTGGLPVLIELLAGTNPQPGSQLPDISNDAVKRFLQWVPDEERRRVALLAAVPRQFNSDILGAVLERGSVNPYAWLAQQNYIRTETTRGSFYHDKVRELMLRNLRFTTPSALSDAHGRLSQYFQAQQDLLSMHEKSAYDSEAWRKSEVERCYHQLCAKPERNLVKVLDAFLMAFRWRSRFAESVAQAALQASHEVGSHEEITCATLMLEFFQAYVNSDYEKIAACASQILQYKDLSLVGQAIAFARRGESYRLMRRHEEALADLDRAIELDGEAAWVLHERGHTYRQMRRYEEALADFNRAIELDAKSAWAIASRGQTYQQVGRYEEALADLNCALALDPKSGWTIGNRGETYRQMGRYEEALADFNRAIELDAKSAWLIGSRGETYRQIGRYEEALADFNRAIELGDKPAWAIGSRGQTYRQMGRYEEAVADFNRAIELDAKSGWMISNRGETFRQMGKYEEALADFSRAIELVEEPDTYAPSRRAVVHHNQGRLNSQDADILIVMEAGDEQAETIYHKAVVNLLIGREADALRLLRQAIELDISARYDAQCDDVFRPLAATPEFVRLVYPIQAPSSDE